MTARREYPGGGALFIFLKGINVTDSAGFCRGMDFCTLLSDQVMSMPEDEAEGFVRAIGDWYNFVGHGKAADWMIPGLPDQDTVN